MSTPSLVFRLYGNFIWPPQKLMSATAERKRGCVEIHYARTSAPDNPYQAFLVWVPQGQDSSTARTPPAPTTSLDHLPQPPHEWIASNENAPVWIGGSDGNTEDVLLAFRGAYFFEQYRIDDNACVLELGWPLVPEYRQDRGAPYFSSLVVRSRARPQRIRFDIDLFLPLPVMHANTQRFCAFPIRAVYSVQAANTASAGKIDTLVGLGFKNGSLVGFSFEALPGSRLGTFDLAADGVSKSVCAIYAAQPEFMNTGHSLDHYWPTGQIIGRLFLEKAGLSPQTAGAAATITSPADAYLKLTGTQPEKGVAALGYRTLLGNVTLTSLDDVKPPLALPGPVHLELKLTWPSLNADLWAPETWQPRFTFRLTWKEAFKQGDLSAQARSAPGRYLLAKTAEQANVTRQGLGFTETLQPVSILPGLQVDADRTVAFVLCSASVEAQFDVGPQSDFGGQPLRWSTLHPVHLRLTLAQATAASPEALYGTVPVDNHLPLQATLPGFAPAGVKLQLTLKPDEARATTEADSGEAGSPYFASFALKVAPPSGAWTGRIGSLVFNIAKPGTFDVDDDFLRTAGRAFAAPWPRRYTDKGTLLNASIRLTLPISRVQPLSTDVARIDRTGRPAPLLIDLSADQTADADNKAQYYLQATETFGSNEDRLLTVSVLDNDQQQGERDYLSLAEAPYSILRFRQVPLGARGDAGDTTVATYSSDDRLWQFRSVSPLYHFMLPPQAIGESADKPNCLELHDVLEMPDDGKPLRPDVPLHQENHIHRYAVEFRLTPSTDLWVRPSDTARGFFIPEQASYELFRQRGDYGLGVALVGLRSEFLYGLSVSVEVAAERAEARYARVAEIGAMTGAMVGPPHERHVDQEVAKRWNGLSWMIARRSERLEVWTRDPASPVDFAPARFTQGTRFALRSTALHRYPVAQVEPAGGEVPEALPGHLRFHPQGLSGGALWPVESANLLRALEAMPQSRGGVLERVALAPFGGDAAQSAEFLNGNVKIISETRNGTVERQKIEVNGRIGALWHRAKHVVVYERTVSPTAQFAPPLEAMPRSRRPILRKVSEYIELLQPERLYPDFGQAHARSTGFLDRVCFNSPIINVDSAWGSDVGTGGWQVPLWNRAAARKRPQVYGMPDIAFITVAEGEGDNPLVAQACLDVDMLYFFTDFNAISSDTDLWQPWLDIDYANLPQAKTLSLAADPPSTPNSHGRRPAVSRLLPGARRFTWRLAPAASKTAINAGRAQSPVYVGLESVSFMRATFADKKDNDTLFEPLGHLLTSARSIQSDITPWEADAIPEGLANAHVAEFIARVNTLAASDEASKTAAFDALNTFWGTTFLTEFSGKLEQQAQQLASTVGDGGTGLLKSINVLQTKLVQSVPPCETLKLNAATQLRSKSLLICSTLQDCQAELEGIIVNPGWANKAALIDNIKGALRRRLKPLFQQASDDVGHVQEDVEKARDILVCIEIDAERLFARARDRVGQLSASYDKAKPWSPQRWRTFRSDCQAAVSNVHLDTQGTIDEARQRLSAELGDLAQSIANHLGSALVGLRDRQSKALKDLGVINLIAAFQFGDLLRTLDAFTDGTPPEESARTMLLNAITAAEEAINHSDLGNGEAGDNTKLEKALKQKALDALSSLRTSVGEANGFIVQIRSQVQDLSTLSNDDVAYVASLIKELLASAKALADTLAQATTLVTSQAQALAGHHRHQLADGLTVCANFVPALAGPVTDWTHKRFEQGLDNLHIVDFYVAQVDLQLKSALDHLLAEVRKTHTSLDNAAANIAGALGELSKALAPEHLLEPMVARVVERTLDELFAPFKEHLDAGALTEIRVALTPLAEKVSAQLKALDKKAQDTLGDVSQWCKTLDGGLDQAASQLNALATPITDGFKTELVSVMQDLQTAYAQSKEMTAAARAFEHSVRELQNDLSRTAETARMYGDRMLAAAGRLTQGGLMAAPSNVLKLYSAVTSAPELAGLGADIERIRADFDELSDIIDTTQASALLNRLGDELKALGLDFPYNRISDRLLLSNIEGMDLGKLFRNIGGADLTRLFSGEKLSDSLREAIRLTHDFNRQQARAWVQVDIDAPLPGRKTLFSIGPFQCDFVDMRISGQMRMEASAEREGLHQTGFGRIAAALDMVVSGQSMVCFEKFALNFSQDAGLKIDFDPNSIRLNPAFQFVQDALLGLFPDTLGPMTVIKENGIPIGLEHEYALPVVSANAVTSGISNISIENRFRLIAHPEFVLSDRFSLSRPERPFIFSLFILGGTGFIQIETEYRPFDAELTVMVDAAAGASALLGISAGPFSGQVFITLSAVLSYRKMVGQPGGGLAISALLVIAGNVDVMGIATVGMYVTLRLAYRDNGQIDADGTLSVTVKISRFFSVTARHVIQYRLRDGTAQVRSSSSVELEADELKTLADKAASNVRKIKQGMV